MSVLRFALGYFALVFAAGFVLGVIRTLLLAPALGEAAAEIVEQPFMILVCFVAARRLLRHARLDVRARLAAGVVALGLLLAAEIALAPLLRDATFAALIAARDPSALVAWCVALLCFALAPLLADGGVGRGGTRR